LIADREVVSSKQQVRIKGAFTELCADNRFSLGQTTGGMKSNSTAIIETQSNMNVMRVSDLPKRLLVILALLGDLVDMFMEGKRLI